MFATSLLKPAGLVKKSSGTLPLAIHQLVLSSGLFNFGGVMGMGMGGPVKPFNDPEARAILTKKVGSGESEDDKKNAETATFAAGCFWGVELSFQRVPGVMSTMVGYTGGHKEHPTYKEVCTGTTGHTEAVQMLFNPKVVSYRELLVVLFDRMDPTTLNRQGNDTGTQYRSGIYYHSDQQKEIADAFVKEVQPKYKDKIAVEIKPSSKFWPAEQYHQKYLENGNQKAEKGCLDPIKCYG